MASCPPSCAVPSCASSPVVGFGSAGLSPGGLGFGYRSGGLAETSGSLGTLAGIIPNCINQIPPSEIVIQPPACVVTIPGPILSASCDPVAVGGNTPCAIGGSGIVPKRGLLGSLSRYSPLLSGGYGNPCLPCS